MVKKKKELSNREKTLTEQENLLCNLFYLQWKTTCFKPQGLEHYSVEQGAEDVQRKSNSNLSKSAGLIQGW